MNHVLSIDQFKRSDIDNLFTLTSKVRDQPTQYESELNGKIITELFYEPSTRTFASFHAAIGRLGGTATPITGVEYSSVSKGETFEDTIQTLAQYADVIVLRHPEVGAAARAADVSSIPIINAGDGVGEHPTQALLDGYTVFQKRGTIDDIEIAMVGDLKNGRTVHSLARLLAKYDNVTAHYVSPLSLTMPNALTQKLEGDLLQNEHSSLQDVISSIDALYMTRTQAERFTSKKEYDAVKNHFVINAEVLQQAKPNMLLMHPLPRVGEIDEAVDSDPRAIYFEQAKNGMYVRMALLLSVLKG